MNFPLELPLFRFLLWLVDTAGLGGIVVIMMGGGALGTFVLTLLWIRRGAEEEDSEVYAYPTSALHSSEEPA